jgi:hypothetical protein
MNKLSCLEARVNAITQLLYMLLASNRDLLPAVQFMAANQDELSMHTTMTDDQIEQMKTYLDSMFRSVSGLVQASRVNAAEPSSAPSALQ